MGHSCLEEVDVKLEALRSRVDGNEQAQQNQIQSASELIRGACDQKLQHLHSRVASVDEHVQSHGIEHKRHTGRLEEFSRRLSAWQRHSRLAWRSRRIPNTPSTNCKRNWTPLACK